MLFVLWKVLQMILGTGLLIAGGMVLMMPNASVLSLLLGLVIFASGGVMLYRSLE